MNSDERASLKDEAHKIFIEIIKLNPQPKQREVFCRELFYTDAISEDLKHVVARMTYRIKPITQWAYANIDDEKVLREMSRIEPLKLSLVPHFVQNKSLNWDIIHNFLYLGVRTKERGKVRLRLLDQLTDEHYAKHSAEFVKLAHSQYKHRVQPSKIIQRVKTANGMADVPDEWLYELFPRE